MMASLKLPQRRALPHDWEATRTCNPLRHGKYPPFHPSFWPTPHPIAPWPPPMPFANDSVPSASLTNPGYNIVTALPSVAAKEKSRA